MVLVELGGKAARGSRTDTIDPQNSGAAAASLCHASISIAPAASRE
jgi:hypothetical protein